MTALLLSRARSTGSRTSRCQRRRPAARAFTLAELLIVVALLALVLSLSLPSLRRLSSKSELQNAARQLRATLLQSRLAAIESGSVTYFRYQPGGGSFEAGGGARRPALSAAAERPSFAEPQRPDSGVAAPDEATPLQLLPIGVRFAEPSTHQPLRPPVATDQVSGDAAWSAPLLFYPNGRTRNARIALVNQAYRIELNVRGLIGTVQISQVERLVSVEAGPSQATAEAAP
jgi:prepilin-type N-terminal cleavage/methylation domain-containing protein